MGAAIIPVGPLTAAKQQTAQQIYGHPNVAANSENIQPPIEKARTRVVEAATKTEVSSNLFKTWEERAARIEEYERHRQMTTYNRDGTRNLEQMRDAQMLDIKA
jgi:hypothetical protein